MVENLYLRAVLGLHDNEKHRYSAKHRRRVTIHIILYDFIVHRFWVSPQRHRSDHIRHHQKSRRIQKRSECFKFFHETQRYRFVRDLFILLYNFILHFRFFSFLSHGNSQRGLKRRVNINLKKFYEQQQLEKFSTEREILNKLAPKLVDEVIEESSSKILKNFPFFYKLFSESTITKLYGIMEEIILAPSQIVYDRNKCIDESFSIYLIVKGSGKLARFEYFVGVKDYLFVTPLLVLYYAETSTKHEEENYNLQSAETMQ